MDEASVREQAEAHGRAMVEGDVNRAGGDLMASARAAAGPVMKAMPNPLKSAEVQSIEAQEDGFMVDIRYGGDEQSIVVRSRWVDDEGRPKIAELNLA